MSWKSKILGFRTKEEYQTLVEQSLAKNPLPGEHLEDIGFAQIQPSLWWIIPFALFLGPFAVVPYVLMIKSYLIALTNKRVLFYFLNSFATPISVTGYAVADLHLVRARTRWTGPELTLLLPGEKKPLAFRFPRFRPTLATLAKTLETKLPSIAKHSSS